MESKNSIFLFSDRRSFEMPRAGSGHLVGSVFCNVASRPLLLLSKPQILQSLACWRLWFDNPAIEGWSGRRGLIPLFFWFFPAPWWPTWVSHKLSVENSACHLETTTPRRSSWAIYLDTGRVGMAESWITPGEPFSVHGGGPQSNFSLYWSSPWGRGSKIRLFPVWSKCSRYSRVFFQGKISTKWKGSCVSNYNNQK